MSYFAGFSLKYSPRTDLIVSGTVSSFRAFFSCSSALSILSERLTMTLFIANAALGDRKRER